MRTIHPFGRAPDFFSVVVVRISGLAVVPEFVRVTVRVTDEVRSGDETISLACPTAGTATSRWPWSHT